MLTRRPGLKLNTVVCPSQRWEVQAINNSPSEFTSKHKFERSDLYARARQISWFANCGSQLAADVSMKTHMVDSWAAAMEQCESENWETAALEARNQLTRYLSKHYRIEYRNWNVVTREHRESVVKPLIDEYIRPFQERSGLSPSLVHSVQWNVLAALMELSYIEYKHDCFFFHELFMVYECGHFPCGWISNWPNGALVVY